MKQRWLALVVILFQFTISGWCTKIMENKGQCPVCGTVNEYSEWMSGGFYYNGDDEQPPFLEEQWNLQYFYLYHCPNCLLTIRVPDYQELIRIDDRSHELAWLNPVLDKLQKENKIVSKEKRPLWQQFELFRAQYAAIPQGKGKSVFENVFLDQRYTIKYLRKLGFLYDEHNKHKEATRVRLEAMKLIEIVRKQGEMSPSSLRETYLFSGNLRHLCGSDVEALRDYRHGLTLNIGYVEADDGFNDSWSKFDFMNSCFMANGKVILYESNQIRGISFVWHAFLFYFVFLFRMEAIGVVFAIAAILAMILATLFLVRWRSSGLIKLATFVLAGVGTFLLLNLIKGDRSFLNLLLLSLLGFLLIGASEFWISRRQFGSMLAVLKAPFWRVWRWFLIVAPLIIGTVSIVPHVLLGKIAPLVFERLEVVLFGVRFFLPNLPYKQMDLLLTYTSQILPNIVYFISAILVAYLVIIWLSMELIRFIWRRGVSLVFCHRLELIGFSIFFSVSIYMLCQIWQPQLTYTHVLAASSSLLLILLLVWLNSWRRLKRINDKQLLLMPQIIYAGIVPLSAALVLAVGILHVIG